MGKKIQESKKSKRKSTLREYAEAAAIALLLALFIRTFVVQAFKIPSSSMVPTLLIGDHILVNKFIYGVKLPFIRNTIIPVDEPERGDVIVFIYPKDPSKDFIKRVIGIPGDKVEIIDEKLFINDQQFQDGHGVYAKLASGLSNPGSKYNFGPVSVPKGHYFVLGDNRNNSQDSRFWGFVPEKLIKGKAFLIYGSWPHWKRTFMTID
jgi:signal peptidase I